MGTIFYRALRSPVFVNRRFHLRAVGDCAVFYHTWYDCRIYAVQYHQTTTINSSSTVLYYILLLLLLCAAFMEYNSIIDSVIRTSILPRRKQRLAFRLSKPSQTSVYCVCQCQVGCSLSGVLRIGCRVCSSGATGMHEIRLTSINTTTNGTIR